MTALISTQDTKYYSVTEAIPLPTFAQIGGRWSIFFPSVLVSDRFYLLPSFFFFACFFQPIFSEFMAVFFLFLLFPSRAGYGNFFLFPINFFLFLADFFLLSFFSLGLQGCIYLAIFYCYIPGSL